MVHLSDWHAINASDRKTYPEVNAHVQVKFDDGKVEEGETRKFFPLNALLPCSSIKAWRYIKDPSQSQKTPDPEP